jgi:rod shape-determining protein MreD
VTPLIYVYFIIKLPADYSQEKVSLLSFLIGLTIDILTNTSGMNAAACTLAGFARPYIIKGIKGEDIPTGMSPSLHTFGYGGFLRLTVAVVALHHLALFMIEAFSLFDPLYFMLRLTGSIMLSCLLIFVTEVFTANPRHHAD